jgi:hypothetical protein
MRSCHSAFGRSLPLGYAGLNDREGSARAAGPSRDERPEWVDSGRSPDRQRMTGVGGKQTGGFQAAI